MKIKGIFFDAADIFYKRPMQTEQYALKLLRQYGYSTELSEADRQVVKQTAVRATEGQITPDEYWNQVFLLRGVSDPGERARLIEQIDQYSDDVIAIPGGKEALAEFKRRGFILGIVTDTMHPIERKMMWLEIVGVAKFIDVVACSSKLGAHKPEPAMYLNAVQQAGLAISESAFVGHDAGELEGARRAGLTTVAVFYDATAKADDYCDSLLDLLNVPIFQKP